MVNQSITGFVQPLGIGGRVDFSQGGFDRAELLLLQEWSRKHLGDMPGELFDGVVDDATKLMLFDPLKCVRCGMCAQKCPTGACKMSVNTFTDTYIEA